MVRGESVAASAAEERVENSCNYEGDGGGKAPTTPARQALWTERVRIQSQKEDFTVKLASLRVRAYSRTQAHSRTVPRTPDRALSAASPTNRQKGGVCVCVAHEKEGGEGIRYSDMRRVDRPMAD